MKKGSITKERILEAARKVFFEHGYEGTSVRMILEESRVVTGSFYHFFSSKEELFEEIIDRYLQEYTEEICAVFRDDSLTMEAMADAMIRRLHTVMDTYYNVLQGDSLHWSIQKSLHDRTLEAIAVPLADAIARRRDSNDIECTLDAEPETLSALLIRGTEVILHTGKQTNIEQKENLIRQYLRLIIKEKGR